MPASAPESSIRTRLLFPSSRRLRTSKEFLAVTRGRPRLRDELFIIQSRPNDHNHARLGVTVSRRVALRANRRNRLKRMIRESFRQQLSALCALDVVVIAQPAADRAGADQIRQSLDQHWQTIRKQCEKSSSS